MKKIVLFTIVCITALCVPLKAQSQVELELSRRFADGAQSLPTQILALPNGDMLVSGGAFQANDSSYAFVLCLTANGDSLWSLFFNELESYYLPSVIVTMAGDIFISHSTLENDSAYFQLNITKVSSQGEVIWNRVQASEGENWVYASLREDTNGQILVSESFLTDRLFPTFGTDLITVAFSQDGDSLWSEIEEVPENEKRYSRDLILSNSERLVWGESASGDSLEQREMFLRRFDVNKEMLWELTIPSQSGIYINDIVESSNGNLFAMGFKEVQYPDTATTFILKVSSEGELLGEFDFPGEPDQIIYGGYDLLIDPDGNLWIAGIRWHEWSDWLVRMDQELHIIAEHEFNQVNGIGSIDCTLDGR